MGLTEKEIRDIWDVIVFDQSDKGGTAWSMVRELASRAVAERLQEGVVYSGPGIVEQPALGATRVRLDTKMDTWAQGEEYIVTVKKIEEKT